MKSKVLLFMLLVPEFVCQAQFKTQQFVDDIPAVPANICKISSDERAVFLNKISIMSDQLDEQIRKLRKSAKVDGEQAKENAIDQMASQYGLSDAEAQKMKSGKKMSAEERAALANKMMMQQTNISMAEMQNMKGMSKEGKKAWAEAYSAEAMAVTEGNKSNSDQKSGASNLNVLQQLQNLNAQVQQRRTNIQKEYEKIENNPERMAMLQKIKAWNSKITAMTGADGGQGQKMDSISVLITGEKKKYCEKYTPMYEKVLATHYADLKASYTDYLRISDLNRAAVNMQPTKVDTPAGTEDDYYKYIDEYLSRLADVFNYTLN